MKISIIVGGRFHAFELAEQLEEKKILEKLITTYPKFYIKKNFKKINLKRVKSIILKEILNRSFGKLNFFNNLLNINDFSSEYFRKKASEVIEYEKIDLILGWSGFSLESFKKANNFSCLKVLERGSSHILHQHEILQEEYDLIGLKPILPTKKNIEIEKQEYELADHIMVPTEFAKNTFIKRGCEKSKISNIPYGVDLNLFKPSQDQKYKKNKTKFRIIYTGALSVRKGVIYLLKAFSELKLKDSELILIGNIDGNLYTKIKKYLNIENIHHYTAKKHTELGNYYSNSDLFVTCSVEEGLAMVQLQAMACGLPLICTENSGGGEIVDQNYNGYIIPIRNVEILKNKILNLYNNPDLLREMGKNSQQKASSLFSWDNYGSKIIEKYNQILNK